MNRCGCSWVPISGRLMRLLMMNGSLTSNSSLPETLVCRFSGSSSWNVP